jgi:hypothetical protein
MKAQSCIPITWLVFLNLLLSVAAPFDMVAQTNNAAQPKAPTGVYVSVKEIIPTFTMRIETNGNYQVDVGACGPMGCFSLVGTWQWDSQRQEFLLNSGNYHWKFDFKRLLVNQREPDTLEWVAREGTGNVLGAYERIKFKRQRGAP